MEGNFHHNISVEDLEGLKKRVVVEYDAEGVKQAKWDAAKEVGKKVQIKGFRKGKAPIALVQSYCRKEIDLTTTSVLTQKGYLHACNEYQLLVLEEPEFDDPKYTDDGGFVSTFTVEVRPKIEPTGYVGLQLEKTEVDKEQIFEQLFDNLKQNYMNDIQLDVVENRTMVTVDFTVNVDSKTVNSGVGQPFFITDESSPPFGGNLIGVSVGEKHVDKITLSKEHEDHGGKEAEIVVEVKSVVKKVEPTDDELVVKTQATSYEDLVNALRQRSDVVAQERQHAALEELAVDKLLDLHEFDVPNKWVENEEKYVLGQFGVETAPDDQTDKFVKDMALRNVRRTFLLESIYDEEPSLKLTQKDLEDVLDSEAKRHGVSPLVVKKEWQDKNMLDSVMAAIKHKKVLGFIIGNAQIIEHQPQQQEIISNAVEITENPMGENETD